MRRLLVFSLIATSLLAVGCKKDEPTTPERFRSYLHIMDAVQQDTFDLTFDYFNADDVVIKEFVYHRNFPITGYADMMAGGTPDEFGIGKLFLSASQQRFVNVLPDTLMVPREFVLTKDERSTVLLADSANSIRFMKIKDEFTFPTDTSIAIRFINVSNVHGNASLTSLDGSISIPSIAFWNNSQFVNFPHGQYDIELHDATGALVTTLSLWLSGRTAYTFFAVGNTLDYFTN